MSNISTFACWFIHGLISIIQHLQISSGVGPYDIGLLKTSTPIKFNQVVQPINLPKQGSEATGTPIIAGWGSTSRTSSPRMPDKLQDAELTYVNIKDCDKAVADLTGSSPVHETNVCTGPLTGGMSACSVSHEPSANYDSNFVASVAY